VMPWWHDLYLNNWIEQNNRGTMSRLSFIPNIKE
jgi:hypothetical protein